MEVKGINVLSLFNGMGTLRQAFHNLGIKVDKYYSSEIKPYAIKLQQHHFPDVIQVGDIKDWKTWDIDWSEIDFIGSGSPCQDLSSAGKRAGLNGSKSSLFFVFIEILDHIRNLNPNVKFLQENVGSASKLDVGIMSRALGVYPVRINSSLLTAQLRDRYYWSNIRIKKSLFDLITDIPQPKDKGIMLKDIITSGYVKKVKSNCLMEGTISKHNFKDNLSENAQKYLKSRGEIHKFITLIYENKSYQINPSKESGGKQSFMQNRIYDVKGKSVALTECMAHKIKYQNEDEVVRTVNKVELCRLQGLPDDFCDILNLQQTGSLLGDGWTLPIIEHILSFYELPNKY
jgi:DNA (cytosine-5)-methyltransferase 3A